MKRFSSSDRILFSNLAQGSNPDDSNEIRRLSLDEWLGKFGKIYGKRHDKHTTEYMISRLVEEVAELVNPMESQNRDEIGPSLADVFSWICSLSFKLNIDLSSLAWEKYGKNAPRPSWSGSSLQDYSSPESLHDWQEFISKVYREENVRLTPMNALVAMMKDVGDLAMLHRKRASEVEITSKIAAMLAWTLTISELLKLDLESVVQKKYDDHCPVCGKEICDTDVCHPFKTMYVSFGVDTSDEEKYAVLDSAAVFGFRTLVNSAATINSSRDFSTSLDLINNSDAACIVLSRSSDYRQVFEALSCYSILSKGNIWIFGKDKEGLSSYLENTLATEKVTVTVFRDAPNLKALLTSYLDGLKLARERH